MIEKVIEVLFIIGIFICICLFIYFVYTIFQGNEEICLGGHYEIRNRIINGIQYPTNTFICDSAKIIYK